MRSFLVHYRDHNTTESSPFARLRSQGVHHGTQSSYCSTKESTVSTTTTTTTTDTERISHGGYGWFLRGYVAVARTTTDTERISLGGYGWFPRGSNHHGYIASSRRHGRASWWQPSPAVSLYQSRQSVSSGKRESRSISRATLALWYPRRHYHGRRSCRTDWNGRIFR